MVRQREVFNLGHLRGYYSDGGRRAWSFIMDTDGSPSPAGDDRAAPSSDGCTTATRSNTRQRQASDVELMRERFAKLLLGEDMSGGGTGVSSAMALSNAITNLAASVFGEQKRLEPMSEETKARWRKEIDWLLSVTDHIVEFVPSRQRLEDGSVVEVMATRQRLDLCMNIPALRTLDGMLIDCLDNFRDQNEFHYSMKDDDDSLQRMALRQEDKWWIPMPKVPVNGLSDGTRKWFVQRRDTVNQVLKAAMAINSQVLSEMEIPGSYVESLPKSGRASLGDSLYKIIMDELFDPGYFLSQVDLSSEHKIVDLKNKLEASAVIWKRKLNVKDSRSSWGSGVSLEKRGMIEERAETILLMLKHRYPGLPQSDLDISKIQCNRDVGLAIVESYSRVIEGLAFTILSRIQDVMHADSLARSAILEQKKHSLEEPSLDEPQNVLVGNSAPTTMTLLDFIGWRLDGGDGETEANKDIQHEVFQKQTPIKKISYMERLEHLGGSRSPTQRD